MLSAPPVSSPVQQVLDHPVLQSSRFFDRLQRIDWPELSLEWGVRIAAALLILGIGVWLAKLLAKVLARGLTRLGVDSILTVFLGNLTRAVCIVVVVVAAMDEVGLPTTSLLAVIGAAGLGIGLALKDSLSNIAAGVMLIALRPFRAGDEVEVAGLPGIVEQVRIFQTVLRTNDNRRIVLPNGLIVAAPITNYTVLGQRRVELTIAIAYGDDIRVARTELLAAARANPRVLPDPAPDAVVTALADTSMQVSLRAWVASGDYAAAICELLEEARLALDACGVNAPHPHHVVHLHAPTPPVPSA